MIEVCRYENGITIFGHAGYSEAGQDIVCAAISALTQVLIASVEELTTDKIQSDIAAGNTVIQYRDLSGRGQLLIDSFFLGVKMIAEEYPANVRVV